MGWSVLRDRWVLGAEASRWPPRRTVWCFPSAARRGCGRRLNHREHSGGATRGNYESASRRRLCIGRGRLIAVPAIRSSSCGHSRGSSPRWCAITARAGWLHGKHHWDRVTLAARGQGCEPAWVESPGNRQRATPRPDSLPGWLAERTSSSSVQGSSRFDRQALGSFESKPRFSQQVHAEAREDGDRGSAVAGRLGSARETSSPSQWTRALGSQVSRGLWNDRPNRSLTRPSARRAPRRARLLIR